MPHGAHVRRIQLLCDVCEQTKEPLNRLNVSICKDCAHPKRVRVFFQCCGIRLDLSLQEAQKLFSLRGWNIWRTGVVLRFPKCPTCDKDQIAKPVVFNIHVSDSELEFASSVAQC